MRKVHHTDFGLYFELFQIFTHKAGGSLMFKNARAILPLLTALTILVLALGACAAPAATPAAAPADGAPAAKIKVKIGTNAEYRPFEFVDENTNIVGFDVDLLNALAEEAGFELEWVNTKWDGIFVALASGEFDAVASAVTITEERSQAVDFTDPYFNAGQTMAVAADNATLTGPDGLVEGVKVGVQLGTTGDIYVSENTKAQVERFDEVTMALQALANKDVDAVVADAPTVADYIKSNPNFKAKIVGEPFTDEFYGIAVNKNKPEIRDAFNKALATIKGSGKYDEIYNKWFGAGQ
jgi:polar amino acid transport system substrate-binding protein